MSYRSETIAALHGDLKMRISAPVWNQVFERDNGCCQYCGADLLVSRAAFSSAQVDHVHAVAAGGELEELVNLAHSLVTTTSQRLKPARQLWTKKTRFTK
jgi:5-methylcytosine-specific restriction endonuclease McrA